MCVPDISGAPFATLVNILIVLQYGPCTYLSRFDAKLLSTETFSYGCYSLIEPSLLVHLPCTMHILLHSLMNGLNKVMNKQYCLAPRLCRMQNHANLVLLDPQFIPS